MISDDQIPYTYLGKTSNFRKKIYCAQPLFVIPFPTRNCFLWKHTGRFTEADVEVLAHPGDKYCEDRQDDVNSFFTSCFITLGSFIITSTLKVHTHFQASVKSRS